jgi:PPOX class probable F420-dependent enzyme
MAVLTDEVRALLEAPNVVHLATLMPDGSPHSVAVWAGTLGDRVVFFTQETSRKARNVAADPRVAISLIDRDNAYRTARIRGKVVATRTGDDALVIIDEISQKYTGAPFPMRSGTVYEIEPEHVGFMELPFRDEPPSGG